MWNCGRLIAGAITSLSLFMAESELPIQAAELTSMQDIEEGKRIAFDRNRGNCLACHQMDDGISPGDIGPPLIAMKGRFPDKSKLREQIWDAMETNPETRMPPFGRYRILTEDESDRVVEYVYTL